MRSPRLRCLVAFFCLVALSSAASFDERVEALFRSRQGEVVALSPDGRRIAYTTRRHGELVVVLTNLDLPRRRWRVPVTLPGDVAAAGNTPPPETLRFLRWATNDRLVFAPAERTVPLPPLVDPAGHATPNPDGPTILAPILVADAKSRERGMLVDARNFQETPAAARRTLADLLRTPSELAATHDQPVHWRMPHIDLLGFLPSDRDRLIIRTRGAYSMPMLHVIDVTTGDVQEFGDQWHAPAREGDVFDSYRLKVVGRRVAAARPATVWQDAEFARLQRELETRFPRRVVEILDWNDTRLRVLFRVTGGTDPGRVFVYERPEDLAVEVLRLAPWLETKELNPTRFFAGEAADGTPVNGYVTWPAQPRRTPPPLLLVFPDGNPAHAQPAFDPEAQIFADWGFVVARLNARNLFHHGGPRLDAPTAVADAQAAIRALAVQHPPRHFDAHHVVTLGRGAGGDWARRAPELDPETFCCALVPDAPAESTARILAGTDVDPAAATDATAARVAAFRRIRDFLAAQPDVRAVFSAEPQEAR